MRNCDSVTNVGPRVFRVPITAKEQRDNLRTSSDRLLNDR